MLRKPALALLVLLAAGGAAVAQGIPTEDTVFYNAAWKPAPRAGAVYYRTFESKQPDSIVVVDRYRNGVVQMRGAFRSLEPEVKRGAFVFYAPDASVSMREWYTPDGTPTDSVVHYYPSGQISSVAQVTGGKMTGSYRTYYAGTGYPSIVGQQEDNQYVGQVVTYHPDGKHLLQEIRYENGLQEGAGKEYDSAAHFLRYYGNYKAGKPDGLLYEYYANGKVRYEGTFRDGQKHGPARRYHENGKLREETSYVNDVPAGPARGYYADGSKMAQFYYSDSVLNGPSVVWDSATGRKTAEGAFVNGGKSGKWTNWLGSGKERLVSESEWAGGARHGSFRQYYEKGERMIREGSMYRDAEDGTWTYYFPNGKDIQSVKEWKGGVLHGTLMTYYPGGKVRRIEKYDAGELTAASCYTEAEEDTAYYPRARVADTAAFVPLIQAAIRKVQPGLAGQQVALYFTYTEAGDVMDLKELTEEDPLLDARSLSALRKLHAPDLDEEDGMKQITEVVVEVGL